MTKTSDQLRQELREAEKREAAEKEARREATPLKWEFTITPSERVYDKVYDDTCRLYQLAGRVTNEKEARAAGHDLTWSGGSMTYLFNTATGKIVMATGGGTIYISDGIGITGDDEDEAKDASRTFEEINAFLAENPEGGDITEIVLAHRQRRGVS